jgi:hypothetical protein
MHQDDTSSYLRYEILNVLKCYRKCNGHQEGDDCTE